jgi:hypothetical protein
MSNLRDELLELLPREPLELGEHAVHALRDALEIVQ